MGTFEQGIRVVAITLATLVAIAGMSLLGGCSDDSGSASPAKPPVTPTTPKTPPEPTAGTTPPATSKPAAETRTPEELVEAGRAVYLANCIACHNMNPAQDGALGPAVAGSSLELLRARIVRGDYPDGYTPKRPSRVMIALPHLEPNLSELEAYLASAQ